jgi:hypothetical protein
MSAHFDFLRPSLRVGLLSCAVVCGCRGGQTPAITPPSADRSSASPATAPVDEEAQPPPPIAASEPLALAKPEPPPDTPVPKGAEPPAKVVEPAAPSPSKARIATEKLEAFLPSSVGEWKRDPSGAVSNSPPDGLFTLVADVFVHPRQAGQIIVTLVDTGGLPEVLSTFHGPRAQPQPGDRLFVERGFPAFERVKSRPLGTETMVLVKGRFLVQISANGLPPAPVDAMLAAIDLAALAKLD